MSTPALPWHRPLAPRDPEEEHRASTPLELFLDLCFVVAVSASASVLHHDLTAGHVLGGLLGYFAAFFAIWWAWVNYSWLASAYDSQDIRFRLMTFVVMIGVLVLAAGVPRGQGGSHDFRVMVVGYVLMRLAVVWMWFCVARDDPPRRRAALRYAWGVIVVQVLWVARTWLLPYGAAGWVLFVILGIGEFFVPWFAERRSGTPTPWHRHHVAERYELFTIIVLGEVLLATTQAISGSLDATGFTAQLGQLIVGALLIVFSLWWLYFKSPIVEFLTAETAFLFGYAHYFVFASVAAAGAGLGAAVDALREHHTPGNHAIITVIAGALVVFAIALALIRWLTPRSEAANFVATLLAIALVAVVPIPLGTAILTLGLILAASVVAYVVNSLRVGSLSD